jgi:hypothetical protein
MDAQKTHELRHALLRLGLAHDIDSKVVEMCGEIRIDLGVIAQVAIDV